MISNQTKQIIQTNSNMVELVATLIRSKLEFL